MQLETINKLFLELSQVTTALTNKEKLLANRCAALERLNDSLKKERDKQRSASERYCHAILEYGVDFTGPGCRCEDCAKIAREMEDAGYIEDAHLNERWWIDG